LKEQTERDYAVLPSHLDDIRATREAARAEAVGEAKRPEVVIKALDASNLDAACALLEKQFPGESPSLGLRASLDPSQYAALVEARTAQGLRPPRDMHYVVATDPRSGAVIGVCGDYRYADEKDASWVGWFAVAPEARGEGVGGALLDAVVERARARGDAAVRLYTSDSDREAGAQHLYESRGLRITGYGARDAQGEKLVYRELAL
jgi:GNAT superfamily N-acetyltransferase